MSTYNSEGSEESESESAYWSTGIGRHLQCSLKVAKNQKRSGIEAKCVVEWEKRTFGACFSPVEGWLSVYLAKFWGLR